MTDLDQKKSKQAIHYNETWSQATNIHYEANRYHDYFRYLPFKAIKQLLDTQNETLDNKSLLIAGCGMGADIHYLRKFYAPKITVTDISEKAVRVSCILNHGIEGKIADTEMLPFRNNSFEFAFTAASLHHLPRPLLGVYELLRVARVGIIVIEPNDSWLTRLATRLGLATQIESAGNYVYRFSAWDIERLAQALFLKSYISRLFAIHRVANNAFEFYTLKLLNAGANFLYPRVGNYIAFFIRKNLN